MADLPSRRDYFQIGAEVIRQRATRIDPAQIETDGSDVNLILASEAAMAEEVTRQLALAEQRLLLDASVDQDLDRWSWDRYQVTRKGAAAALGTVEFSRISAAAGGGTIALGTLLQTDTGIQYKTLADVTFGALDVGPISVTVQAVQAGKETQVGANTINAFVSLPFDATITVDNPEPTAGGEPRETDDQFRERVRDFFRTSRRGILAAIEQGALAVPGVVSAKAIEVTDDLGIPQRFVDLFIADSDGVSSTAQAALVGTSLLEYRAGGIYVRISTSVPIFVDVLLRLRFQANVDTLTLTSQVRNAVLAFINALPTQATLYVSDLFAVLQRFVANGLIVESDAVQAPVGDLIPGTGETIRTTLDRVTVE